MKKKHIFIILGIVIVIGIVIGGVFTYNHYTKQKQAELKQQEQLEKSETYFFEYLQETVAKVEKQMESSYSLCTDVANQLKKYGEAKTFYSAYNSYYIRSSHSDVKTKMETLDIIKPKSNKYQTEHEKVIELYNSYKDIFDIGMTVPNSTYEDYAYTIAKEKAEYNKILEEVRKIIPKKEESKY